MSNDFKTGGGFEALSNLQQSGGADDSLIGRTLGEYRVVRLLAEGGMGRVYLAERQDGSFEREVAIKISPASVLSEELRERALQEQGVLAGLNHPNICQLYDAGITPEGWPYLVMEYIDGVPIDTFCRDNRYSHDEIVSLFLAILDAVGYAHSRLIVHRDIKPNNTLVTPEGQPKLLDFGIAKLLEGDQALTRDSRPLSPRFASPEQLLGREITTASDIYQLGALLGELLVGRPLQADQRLEDAIARAASERPLTLAGDDWQRVPLELRRIVEQCLCPDPAERYPAVNALRQDLLDYQRGYPVQAIGQNPGYRLRKFIKRNQLPVLAVSLTVLGVVALTAWYTQNLTTARDRAEAEAANARQVSDFLIGMFAAANPDVAGRADVTVREVLDEQAEKVRTELEGQPETRARLMVTIAEAYKKLGRFEDGLTWATRATGMAGAFPDPGDYRFTAQGVRISLMFDLARYDKLEQVIPQHIEDTVANFGPESEQALTARNRLAALYGFRGEFDRAIPLFRAIYADCITSLGRTHTLTLKLAGNLAAFLQYSGSPGEAVEVTREAYRAASAVLPRSNEQVLALLYNMASAYNEAGNHEASLQHFEDYRDRVTEFYGPDSYQVLLARRGLGVALSALGDHARAAEIQAALARQEAQLLGPEHPDTLSTRQNLANTLTQLGRVDEALSILDDVLAKQGEVLGPDHYLTLTSRVARADALFAAGDPSATAYFETTRDDVRAALGQGHQLMQALDDIASTYLDAGSAR